VRSAAGPLILGPILKEPRITVYRTKRIPTEPETSLGIGFAVLTRSRRGRALGVMLDIRIFAAPGVLWERSSGRCTGPCDMQPPSLDRYDVGGMMAVTLPFSK
jgi:hypothetical protein